MVIGVPQLCVVLEALAHLATESENLSIKHIEGYYSRGDMSIMTAIYNIYCTGAKKNYSKMLHEIDSFEITKCLEALYYI